MSINLDIEIIGNGYAAKINRLNPFDNQGNPITKDIIINELKRKKIVAGIDERLLDFYIKKLEIEAMPLTDIIIAAREVPIIQGSEIVEFAYQSDIGIEEIHLWAMILSYFNNLSVDSYYDFPFKLKLIEKGETIARVSRAKTNVPGVNIYGSNLSSRLNRVDFVAGENVYYDDKKKIFIAGATGYVLINNGVISVINPYLITDDKLYVLFLNLPRVEDKFPSDASILEFCNQKGLKTDILENKLPALEFNNHIPIIQGHLPEPGQDATIEFKFKLEKTVGTVDETGKIDYKEKNTFLNIDKDSLLAIKKLPVPGKPGIDVFGQTITPPMPKDIVLKAGPGTRKEEYEEEVRVFSNTDGVIEFDNNYITVSPKIIIHGDVDYESGNIDTKANVEIKGNVKGGFKVKSQREIIIKGDIEDNCIIEAKGDINIGGGIFGEQTFVSSAGKISAKFIEFANVKAKGQINVLRFVMGAKVETQDNLIIFGQEINLNERGALLESIIKVRKLLMCPVIGNEKGNTNEVFLAFDESLDRKIQNGKETCDKIREQIEEIIETYSDICDLNSPAVYKQMDSLSPIVKENVIKAIQEKNKLTKRLEMMDRIYQSSLSEKERMVRETAIKIDRKCYPKLIVHCNDVHIAYDVKLGQSTLYYDFDTMNIERKLGL